MKNNIFELHQDLTFETGGSNWSHNVFYGNHPPGEPSDANKITSDPQFVNAGGASDGKSTADAYKLKSTSPLLDSANYGTLISDNGGKEFLGQLGINHVRVNTRRLQWTGRIHIGRYQLGRWLHLLQR